MGLADFVTKKNGGHLLSINGSSTWNNNFNDLLKCTYSKCTLTNLPLMRTFQILNLDSLLLNHYFVGCFMEKITTGKDGKFESSLEH